MKKWVFVILMFCVYSYQNSQPISPNEREILQLQDQRSLGNGKLIAFLQDQNPHIRYRAAIALANIQDTTTVTPLAKLLNDPEVDVRVASALALGQIRSYRAADVLLTALSSEKDSAVVAGMLDAIGKCGSQKNLDSLLSLNEQTASQFPKSEFALCIARFAIRQIKTERSIWKCFEYATGGSPEQSAAALFALWRSAPNGLIDLEITKQKDDLLVLATNQNSEVRMHLANLLGRSKSAVSREILDALEKVELRLNDWHVLVPLIRARAAISSPSDENIPRFLGYLTSRNDHVKCTALQGLRSFPSLQSEQLLFTDSLRMILRAIIQDDANHEAVRGEACITLGKYFPAELGSFHPWLKNTQISPIVKAKYLEGIAQQITKEHLDVLRQNLNHESNRVAMAAWDFIRPMLNPFVLLRLGLDSNGTSALTRDILNQSNTALEKNDVGITTVVANLFADTMVFRNVRGIGLSSQVVNSLCSAFRNFTHSDDSETQQAILQALGAMKDSSAIRFLETELLNTNRSIAAEAAASLLHITGRDYSASIRPPGTPKRTEEDWAILENVKQHQRVLITTNRGEFMLDVLKEHAPFTVLNFVKLVKNKFYDGLSFHRVIADFVVQGGDPRGDGWGGPGYSMRTEISTMKYERGSCGMASAGKDTEGSQFFITHISTPHLDGRYTIFGRVVQGMEVVDRLQIGDTIKTTRLVEE